jgi:N-acetylmuramoyl-L-alanine amidase
MTLNLKGKVSHFGGPLDSGVSESEGLAWITSVEQKPEIFLSYQPEGTTGLARRLNPVVPYIACRWDYAETPVPVLLEELALVTAKKTGRSLKLHCADWGPHQDTGRVADISPGAMEALGIETDDEVEVIFPYTARGAVPVAFNRIVISSGHGKHCQGAVGLLNEVECARAVVDAVADELRDRGVDVVTFHDNTSHDQQTNLKTIVDAHNSEVRDLDVSVHLNAYIETPSPMGTECLYVTQSTLAEHVAGAIASVGFINRGAKKRTDLYFLNQTQMPSILIEVCFVDSSADAELYRARFAEIVSAIADVLTGDYQVAHAKG